MTPFETQDLLQKKKIQELKRAATRGDVEFLRNNFARDQPDEYYLSCFQLERELGNIFHHAVLYNREEFVKEAISILPSEAVQQLLLQLTNDPKKNNPLHGAAANGNVEIVKMLLQVYQCLPTLPSDLSKRPWLQENSQGLNPCLAAVYYNHEECALELLKMDKELFCQKDGGNSLSLLIGSIQKCVNNLTLEILKSPDSVNVACTGKDGYTAFHAIIFLEGSEEKEKIFRLLLQREPELYKQTDKEGNSACHYWASDGKVWPFKCLLESQDIVPNLKRDLADLVSSTNNYGYNTLHYLVKCAPIEEDAMKIAELLVQTYKKEVSPPESGNLEDQCPWLMHNDLEETPLSLAIARQFEQLALYIMSLDANTVVTCKTNVLFLAIRLECHEAAKMILEMVDKQGWTQLLRDHQHKRQCNVLYLAPLCKIDFCKRLIEEHIELLTEVNKGGSTILHSWIKHDNVIWLFELILKSKWRSSFLKLIDAIDYDDLANPFHYAATNTHDATEVVKLLVEAIKEQNPRLEQVYLQPWFRKDKKFYGPLHWAIRNHHEDLALYILSLYQPPHLHELLDYYEPEHFTVFLAIESNCGKVAQAILSRLDKRFWTEYVRNFSDGCNILHSALLLKDIECGKWLVNEAPEFITQKDNNRQSPWERAFEVGSAWFIKEVMHKDPSTIDNEPMAWIEACNNGHVSALSALIKHDVGAFRELCMKFKDSPLHHIRLPCLKDYEEFLEIERMKDFINVQNHEGETPLHRAIRKRDIFLTETLLNIDKIIYDIKDGKDVTAMDLLAHLCKEDNAWDLMCKRNGLDPSIKTTYFQHKTNLLDVRTSLFVVAALVTTITFAAGFTLPGGFNQDTGEAILGKKPSFIVFLLSDTLALVFSMLVLICLTLSMVYEPSKSLILIDRSMVLLRMALNFTLVAFMTGVYIVMSPKSLWATILIILITSSLIIISINKNVLFKVMDKFFPSANKECKDPMRLAELGYMSHQDEQDPLLADQSEQLSSNSTQSTELQANQL